MCEIFTWEVGVWGMQQLGYGQHLCIVFIKITPSKRRILFFILLLLTTYFEGPKTFALMDLFREKFIDINGNCTYSFN